MKTTKPGYRAVLVDGVTVVRKVYTCSNYLVVAIKRQWRVLEFSSAGKIKVVGRNINFNNLPVTPLC